MNNFAYPLMVVFVGENNIKKSVSSYGTTSEKIVFLCTYSQEFGLGVKNQFQYNQIDFIGCLDEKPIVVEKKKFYKVKLYTKENKVFNGYIAEWYLYPEYTDFVKHITTN